MSHLIFLFSGQGSQYHEMGRDLWQEQGVFADWMRQGDQILADLGRPGFLKEVYDQPMRTPFSDLLWTHPGLVIIQVATFHTLKALGICCERVFGFSVGEFAAAVAAGVMEFHVAVAAAYEQARLIVQHCQKGGTLAVLEAPELYDTLPELRTFVTISGINFNRHFTLTGSADGIKQAAEIFKRKEISYQELPIDYPFHSDRIEGAHLPFLQYGEGQMQLKSPQIPFHSCLSGECHEFSVAHFWDVVAKPLNFQRAIQSMEGNGPNLYVDLGPSGTVANFVKYNLPPNAASKSMPLITRFHSGSKNIRQMVTAETHRT